VDPPTLKWSILRYAFGHEKEDCKCGESTTSRRRSSPSCGRLMCWFRREEPLQGRTLHRAAREAPIVILFGERNRSGMTLAHDIGLAGFALRVERIELLLEAVIGRLAGIDRTAKNLAGLRPVRLAHLRPPWPRRSAAIGTGRPSQAKPNQACLLNSATMLRDDFDFTAGKRTTPGADD